MRSLLPLLLFMLGAFAAVAKSEPEKVRVEFEWEEIMGATEYEVELLSKEKKSVQKMRSSSSSFAVQLSPGLYYVRGRVYDRRKAKGEWSEVKEFAVPPRKIETVDSPFDIQVDAQSFLAPITISWNSPVGAHHFDILLFDENGKVIENKRTHQSQIKLNLRPGAYSYKIIPYTKDGVEGEAFDAPQIIAVKSRPVPENEDITMEQTPTIINLHWKNVRPLLTAVRLEYQKHFGDTWRQISQVDIADSYWASPKGLKPGKYKVSLWNKNRFGDISGIKNLEFTIKPLEEDLP